MKIGIGFLILIIFLVFMTFFWAASRLGVTLEYSDIEKIQLLRDKALNSWAREQTKLASAVMDISEVFSQLDVTGRDRLLTVNLVEKLKRYLNIDWIDILENDRPIIFPAIELENSVLTPSKWPIRLRVVGPLSRNGYLTASAKMRNRDAYLVVAKKAEEIAIPLLCLWDKSGVLVGDRIEFTSDVLKEYSRVEDTFQRLQKGRLFRAKTFSLGSDEIKLLAGYEADAATLTKTNVNDLMIQLALLEVFALLLLGYYLGQKLFKPLEKLKTGMERVANGHWQELPISISDDEIGAVAHSFNHMVKELSTAQNRLVEIQRELMAKEKMAVLGRFSAGIAHEINNPLGTILVSSEMIIEAMEKNRKINPEDVEAIISETKRCRGIVDSLLRYARNRPSNICHINLSNFFSRFCTKISEIVNNSAEVSFSNETLATEILADELGIEQIVTNLIRNSIDAVEGISKPQISFSIRDLDDNRVIFSVRDNGRGISEIKDNIFEPFYTTKASGTGLGLAISQSIIEGHGEKIKAETLETGETEFSFTLRKA
ncbi:MAG: HAMP domain-containing histidine kinase [Candidatus Riflebacteria bacterium]|nr:HAMP domain-containing histidine kinase [Candidatus Riflebacteria bacterium]